MLERCPKCQVFMEESLETCPSCHFDFRPPSDAPLKPAARSFVGWPEFMKRERYILVGSTSRPAAVLDVVICVFGLALGFWYIKDRFENGPAAISALPAMTGAPVSPRAARPSRQEEAPERAGPPLILTGEPDASEPAVRPAAAAHAGRKRSAVSGQEWVFEGRILNLTNLQPIKAADIVVEDFARGRRYETSSLPDGYFSVTVPSAANGYYLKVTHPKFINHVLIEKSSEPRQMTMAPDERMRHAIRLSQTLIRSEPVIPDSGSKQELTLFLAPRDFSN